jgi:hypothetical protein
MSPNQSGTFSYAPDIACSVYTTSGVLDLSADIVDLTVTRSIAAVSQVHIDLANPGKKYNRVINTMDRIVVFLKRTDWVQVFTGYVTFAPIETLIPTTVTISADCTLRILQNTYWDDTLLRFQKLLLNIFDNAAKSSNATVNDGGVAQAIINIVTGVCGWDPSKIHIQGIPMGLLEIATKGYNNVVTGTAQNAITELSQILGSSSYIAGNSTSTGSYNNSTTQTVSGNQTVGRTPPGVEFTANYVEAFYTHPLGDGAKANWPGKNSSNPVSLENINHDMYYASIPFAYAKFDKSQKEDVANAKSWISHFWPGGNKNDPDANLRGRLLLVSNASTNKIVALRATSLVQKPDTVHQNIKQAVVDNDVDNIDHIQVHPGVLAYLNGDVDDPEKFKVDQKPHPPRISAYMHWADEKTVTKPGRQKELEQAAVSLAKQLNINNTNSPPANPKKYESAQQAVISYAVSQTGAKYSQGGAGGSKDVYNGRTQGRESPKSANSPGYFDCSGLVQWAYSKIGVSIGGVTTTQWGTGTNSDNNTHGTLIPKNVRPQPGDIMFWNVHGEGGAQPGHVTMLSVGFDKNDKNGKMMAANSWGLPAGEQPVNWTDIQNGGELPGWSMSYMGARRPLDLTDPTRTYTFPQTTTTRDKSSKSDPLSPDSNIASLAGSFSMLMSPPTFDPRAAMIVGTPRAFLLDNNVMSDFSQIIGGGLRTYMSAPNGDLVCWFPDYYGFYGTDPVLDISPVEIIDFQIYHDDNQLITHYGVIGDTVGFGQQVSELDFMKTNGIVSIEDPGTMSVLFGKHSAGDPATIKRFLQRYGLRPMVREQNMIHSHIMEYIYALTGFMQQWVSQFSSTVSLTFMPELYPGMRVSMDIPDENNVTHNYQFYCMSVTHQCSRVGGFTTQANFTAPMKDGVIMDYGLGLM